MNLLRRAHRFPALLALISLLFTQMALAWYECPMESPGAIAQQSAAAQQGSIGVPDGCDGMDAAEAALCYAHAQVGNQSFDKPVVPHVQPFIEAWHYVVAIDFHTVAAAPAARVDSSFLLRTGAPPIAVRNCCFRI